MHHVKYVNKSVNKLFECLMGKNLNYQDSKISLLLAAVVFLDHEQRRGIRGISIQVVRCDLCVRVCEEEFNPCHPLKSSYEK